MEEDGTFSIATDTSSLSELKWTKRFMALAEHIAGWSKDPSTKVGAVIVGKGHEGKKVLGIGFNGFPRGVDDSEWRYQARPVKYSLVVHSEANAILDASGRQLHGCALITTKFPCSACAKLIIQAGIATVICPAVDLQNPADERWYEDAKIASLMFGESDVSVFDVDMQHISLPDSEMFEEAWRAARKRTRPTEG